MIIINLNEFGLLVKALRKSSMDEYGNRWTRESLSKAIHLTPNQLGRLERGDRKYIDNQTLELLAKAFKLTNLEQKEFIIAASGLKDEVLFQNRTPENQMDSLISLMESLQVPAFALDPYGDIIAANTSSINCFCITKELIDYASTIPAGLNHIRFIYSSEYGFKNIVGACWRKAAIVEMYLFRRSTLRYRHTDYFNYLFKALLKEKEFDIDWYASQRSPSFNNLTYEAFNYNHPRYGPISYTATETIVHTKEGDLYLIIYNPADKLTTQVFYSLNGPGKNHVKKLASWPEKVIP
ncbi:MAG: helix-turn-helix domain-containing protein [Bacillota bacterium]